jgi:CDP-diacylglycerol--serine O-phosphatidyltransferase
LLHLAENNRDLQRWGALGLPPLLALIALLMISTVRYPSGKGLDLQTSMKVSSFVLIVAIVGTIFLFKEVGLLACALSYIFFGVFRYTKRQRVSRRTTKSV